MLAVWLLSFGCTAPLLQPEKPVVIVLSWDGTRHDYPDRAETPALDRMQRDGLRAGRLVPVFPSNTFPNHVALATGTHPDRHGIVNNRFFDPRRGEYDYANDASWIDAEPIWAAAERQGRRAATLFWVGSETDWQGRGASLRRAPFDGTLPESDKVDQILEWLDLPESERPQLIMSWWHGCDSQGHALGPDDPEIARQLERQDRELLRLLQALDARDAWSTTTLLVLSDHGMAEVSQRIDPLSALRARGIRAKASLGGGMAYVYLDRSEQREDALAILRESKHIKVYASEAAPAELRVHAGERAGQLLLTTEPPYAFSSSRRPAGSQPSLEPAVMERPQGGHGYAPERADMGAIFFALGRGVRAGTRIESLRAIDVAPTIAGLLGIDPPSASEGEPVAEIATGAIHGADAGGAQLGGGLMNVSTTRRPPPSLSIP